MLSTLELAHLIVTIKQPKILSILELAHLNVTYKQPIIHAISNIRLPFIP